MESNDSPEIPDRGETSDIPGLPSGDTSTQYINNATEIEGESVTGYRVSSIVSVHIDTIHKQRYKNRERA